jgi:hypothetical protein
VAHKKAGTIDIAIAYAVKSERRLLVTVGTGPGRYRDGLREGAPTVGRRRHRRGTTTRVLLYNKPVPVLRVEKHKLGHALTRSRDCG